MFKSCRWIIWHYKNKANLGSDWGRSHESILHLRKSKGFTFNIDTIRIPYSEHTLKYPSHLQAETSQFGKGKSSEHVWEPNALGAKPKDVLEIPTDLASIAIANFFTVFIAALTIGLMKKQKFKVSEKESGFGKKTAFLIVYEGIFLGISILLFAATLLVFAVLK